MNRLNSHFLRPPPTAPDAYLVTARALWWLALADLVYSLVNNRHHPRIVQAQGRSAKTAVTPSQQPIYILLR
jgi:hypothetical protein